ncbi:hypothetical protein B0H66DRAFT_396426 [Apodospora peruviana]|uniref:Uncharacterized protein n=1 Tax=Apodospora peruviana TaxID=516989 RepID=A0AAE0LYE2_9PEZI|nr:hypothetical protein B0H66DRAFT_396426 [Apodospora peruviana]
MAMIGTVTFTFLIAKPFPYLQTSVPINLVRKPSESPLLIGHRGLGMNLPSHQHLQLGENTIESCSGGIQARRSLRQVRRPDHA